MLKNTQITKKLLLSLALGSLLASYTHNSKANAIETGVGYYCYTMAALATVELMGNLWRTVHTALCPAAQQAAAEKQESTKYYAFESVGLTGIIYLYYKIGETLTAKA